eukprot:GGOE01001785.1.p1 GENE.GGOE01001785.1~~GGOE01001785.1.p1  ORF type:complete len:835 (+),score=176.12 GGOE01001785.1:52-2556(+)
MMRPVHEASSSSIESPLVRYPFTRSSTGPPVRSFSMLLSPRTVSPPLKAGRVLPIISTPPNAPSMPISAAQLLSVSPGVAMGPEIEDLLKPPQPEAPTLLCLAKYYCSWLLPPAGLLLLAMPGMYFVQEHVPHYGALILLAFIQLLMALYFLARVVHHVQSLLVVLEGKANLLCGCDPEQVSSIVSGDERVRFLQLALYHRHASGPQHCPGAEADNNCAPDPLHFLSLDIAARSLSEDGHAIVNPAGTILWCNNALATYFGYPAAELISENVRLLIPSPYNTVHDSLMRKYNRESSMKRIVGCARTVPVVNHAGGQSQVGLMVEERIDPTDEANALFLARMTFPRGPGLLDLVQKRVWSSTDVLHGCRSLKSHSDNFLITDARGQILFASDRLATLLGWQGCGLEGNNLSVLMGNEMGDAHEDYMLGYMKRSLDAHGHVKEWPPSNVVDTGRDLYARCRDGHYLRTWITVHRLDPPSGRPEDCRFLGTVVYMQAPEDRRQGQNDSFCARDGRSSSHSRASRGPGTSLGPSTCALSPVTRKRCTVAMFDMYGMRDISEHEVGSVYEAFLQLLVAACYRHNGQLQNLVGDRMVVALNVVSPNLSQRTAAAALMQHVMEEWGRLDSSLAVPVYCAAVHAQALCATYGRSTVFLGESLDLCACLVRIAAEAHAQNGLIDRALYDELQYAYECRLVNRILLWPKQPNARSVSVYELFALKEVDEDEWMYQIEPREKADPLAHWRSCWEQLEGPPSAPSFRPIEDALDCLEDHRDEYPNDPTAVWLQHVLRQQEGVTEPALPVDMAGKTPYVIMYRSHPAFVLPQDLPPRSPRSAPNLSQ